MTLMPHLSPLAWDEDDRLRSTTPHGPGTQQTTYYAYDASGQRVRKATDQPGTARIKSERVYLGAVEIFREYGTDGKTITLSRETLHVTDGEKAIALVESRTLGTDKAAQQTVRYQHGNHLGSAVLELDDGANIITYEEYFPYGSTSYQAVTAQVEVAKRYRYAGKERDEENDLSYHGARYYAPWLGRWTSCDPAGLTDGTNAYRYVHNNPIRLVDKTGKAGQESGSPANSFEFAMRMQLAYAVRQAGLGVEMTAGLLTGPARVFSELRREGPSTVWTREQLSEHSSAWIQSIKAPWERAAEGFRTKNPELAGAGLAEINWQVSNAVLTVLSILEPMSAESAGGSMRASEPMAKGGGRAVAEDLAGSAERATTASKPAGTSGAARSRPPFPGAGPGAMSAAEMDYTALRAKFPKLPNDIQIVYRIRVLQPDLTFAYKFGVGDIPARFAKHLAKFGENLSEMTVFSGPLPRYQALSGETYLTRKALAEGVPLLNVNKATVSEMKGGLNYYGTLQIPIRDLYPRGVIRNPKALLP